MSARPSPSYAMTVRLEISNKPGMLGRVASRIGSLGGDIGAVDLVRTTDSVVVRDITFSARDERHGAAILDRLRFLRGVRVVNFSDRTFLVHLGGKIEVVPRQPVKTRDDLSMVYTPGVARVCREISSHPMKAWTLTSKRNMVAIVTDGSAVLGLGDIGPQAALPVMEGKAMLFKTFGGVNAFPICLDTKDPREIVETVSRIAVGFGGINLEDISAPRCFEIEQQLQERLDIPVFHDDQHGTAIVVLAALRNALRLVGKSWARLHVVVLGIGAAGYAVSRLLYGMGVRRIIGFDRAGAIYAGREEHMNPWKEDFASWTNPGRFSGPLREALRGCDVLIGLSSPGLLKPRDLAGMARDAIVFLLANPEPEIPLEAAARYARITASGRSDYPNQLNNALAFPGVFRGALDVRASRIHRKMKLAAARAIASVLRPEEVTEDSILPSIFDPRVAPAVAKAVSRAAIATGVARRVSAD